MAQAPVPASTEISMNESNTARLLTLPNSGQAVLTIRAKALIFHDAKSLRLLRQVELIAPSEANVLIIGETGTGKELIARHIHAQSGRSGPFVAVNCGAFSENLVEAELFGHEAGAFAGAQQARAGWFEAANGGTLFLDEVGDLRLPGLVVGRAGEAGGVAAGCADGFAAVRSGLRQLLEDDTPDVYERLENLVFATAFEYCRENQVRTARQLGISRNILRTQLKRFGLIGKGAAEAVAVADA